MVYETQRILGDDSIRVSPTTVRVPVDVGHAEALTIETERPSVPGARAAAPRHRACAWSTTEWGLPNSTRRCRDRSGPRAASETTSATRAAAAVGGRRQSPKRAALNAVQIAEELLVRG